MVEKNYKKYLFWGIIALLILISYMIIKDFIVALVSSFILAYLVRPLHKALIKKINPKISALILLVLIGIIGISLLVLFTGVLYNQTIQSFNSENIEKIVNGIKNYLIENNYPSFIGLSISNIIEGIIKIVSDFLYTIVISLPNIGLNIVIIFFTSYFLIVEWNELQEIIVKNLPFKNNKKIISKIDETSHNIIFGMFLIAIVEFFVAWIGLSLAGVDLAILFAFLMGILVFIPILGPALIWVPLVLFSFFRGDYFSSVIILITGLIISILIDSILIDIIIGKKAKIHPVIVLVGILGGVQIFGIVGLIIGPLILAIFINLLTSKKN